MPNSSAQKHSDDGVTLTLQSLIDERSVAPFSTHAEIQGLSTLAGQIRSRRRGHGLEFEDLRLYTVGDDVRHIDWKVSARHNQLHTRIFREEKEQLVTLALDFTSPMFTGSDSLKAVQAAHITANLAWHVVSAGGRCGMLMQTDRSYHAIKPALGDKAALAICAAIVEQFEFAKADAQYVGTSSRDSHTIRPTLFERLRTSGRSTGAVIALAGLNNSDSDLRLTLAELRIAKQIAVISIEDALEYTTLPTGVFRYRSADTDSSVTLNAKQTAELQIALDRQNQRILDTFSQAQIPLFQSRLGTHKTKAALIAMGFLP